MSSCPVWEQTTTTGFRQKVYIMYYAQPSPNHANLNVLNGVCKMSTSFGKGIPVFSDIKQCASHGDIVFRLLVYPGRVCTIYREGHPKGKTWFQSYGSAIERGKKTYYLKSKAQVKILGVIRGFSRLSRDAQERTNNLIGFDSNTCNTISNQYERNELQEFVNGLGLTYFRIKNESINRYVVQYNFNNQVSFPSNPLSGDISDGEFWTRSWDNLIENKETGHLLYFDPQSSTLLCKPCDPDENTWPDYKWSKEPGSGPLIDKTLKNPIIFEDDEVIIVTEGTLSSYDEFTFEPLVKEEEEQRRLEVERIREQERLEAERIREQERLQQEILRKKEEVRLWKIEEEKRKIEEEKQKQQAKEDRRRREEEERLRKIEEEKRRAERLIQEALEEKKKKEKERQFWQQFAEEAKTVTDGLQGKYFRIRDQSIYNDGIYDAYVVDVYVVQNMSSKELTNLSAPLEGFISEGEFWKINENYQIQNKGTGDFLDFDSCGRKFFTSADCSPSVRWLKGPGRGMLIYKPTPTKRIVSRSLVTFEIEIEAEENIRTAEAREEEKRARERQERLEEIQRREARCTTIKRAFACFFLAMASIAVYTFVIFTVLCNFILSRDSKFSTAVCPVTDIVGYTMIGIASLIIVLTALFLINLVRIEKFEKFVEEDLIPLFEQER